MAGKVSFEQFSDSQNVIQNYIYSDKNNYGTHKAKVKVMVNGTFIFNQKLSIVSLVETNESFVEITWPKEFEKKYYVRYSNWYQIFKFNNDILEIRGENKIGDNINIYIE